MVILRGYRPDIDGLRALAVLFVTFFHLGIGPVTGGFVGVDVFFVISGYLITSIICRDIEERRFSLLNFYNRRFRRIVPALAAVTICSLAVGYYLLLPGDYQSLGRQAIYAAFGVSNFYFLENTGYFLQDAKMMPLLHTWSLGVEEQFYLVWPLLLFAAVTFARNAVRGAVAVLVLIIAGSLVWAIVDVTVVGDQTTAFYMIYTRAWELALGALIVFAPALRARWHSEVLAATGIVMIAASALLLSHDSSFPGANALYPCLGAAMVIAARDARTIVARALSLAPMVWLGLISYSLYLWHWPLLVFYKFYKSGSPISDAEKAWLLIAAVAIAWISWRFIEQPFRRMSIGPRSTVLAGLSASAVVAMLGLVVAREDGLPRRMSPDFLPLQNLAVMWEWPCLKKDIEGLGPVCLFGADWASASKKVFLWGDSHADHLAPILKAAYAGTDTAVMLFDGCAPMLGGSVNFYIPQRPDFNTKCHTRRGRGLEYLRNHSEISLVILVGRWAEKFHRLYSESSSQRSPAIGEKLTVEALTELIETTSLPGRSYLLVGPVPYWKNVDPVQCAAGQISNVLRAPCEHEIPAADFWSEHESIHRALDTVARSNPHVTLLNPAKGLCPGEWCIAWIGREFLYRDTGHFRRNMHPETYARLGEIMGVPAVLKELEREPSSERAALAPRRDDGGRD